MGSSISKSNEQKGSSGKTSTLTPLKFNRSSTSNANIICMTTGTQELLDKVVQSISALPSTSYFTLIFKSSTELTISTTALKVFTDSYKDNNYTFISTLEIKSLGNGKYRVPRENQSLLPIDFSVGDDTTDVEFVITDLNLTIINELCKSDVYPFSDVSGKSVAIPVASPVNVNNKSGLYPYFVYYNVTKLKVGIDHFNTVKLRTNVCVVYKINDDEIGKYFKKYTQYYLEQASVTNTFTSQYLVLYGLISSDVVTYNGKKLSLTGMGSSSDFYLDNKTIKPILEISGATLGEFIVKSLDSACEIFTNLPPLIWSQNFEFLYVSITLANIKLLAIILSVKAAKLTSKVIIKLPQISTQLKSIIIAQGFTLTERGSDLFMHNIDNLTASNIVPINSQISTATFSISSTVKDADYILDNSGKIDSLIKNSITKNASLINSAAIQLDYFAEKFTNFTIKEFNNDNLLVFYSEISTANSIIPLFNALKFRKVKNIIFFTKQTVEVGNSLFYKNLSPFTIIATTNELLNDVNIVTIRNDYLFKFKINNNENSFTVNASNINDGGMEVANLNIKNSTDLTTEESKLYTSLGGSRYGFIKDPLNISNILIQGISPGISYFSVSFKKIESIGINPTATLDEERIVYVNIGDNFNRNTIFKKTLELLNENVSLKLAVIVGWSESIDVSSATDNASIVDFGGEKFVFVYPKGAFIDNTIKFENLKVKFVTSKNDFTDLEAENGVKIQQVTLSDISNLNIDINGRIKYMNSTIFSNIQGLEIYYEKNYTEPPITNLNLFSASPTIINIETNLNELYSILNKNFPTLLHYDFLASFKFTDWFTVYKISQKIENLLKGYGLITLLSYEIKPWFIYSAKKITKVENRIIYSEKVINYDFKLIELAINIDDLTFKDKNGNISEGYEKIDAKSPYISKFATLRVSTNSKAQILFGGPITYPQTQPTVLILNNPSQEEVQLINNQLQKIMSPILVIIKSDNVLDDLNVIVDMSGQGGPYKYFYYKFQHMKWQIKIEVLKKYPTIHLYYKNNPTPLQSLALYVSEVTENPIIPFIDFKEVQLKFVSNTIDCGFWNFHPALSNETMFYISKDLLKIVGSSQNLSTNFKSLSDYTIAGNITLSGFINVIYDLTMEVENFFVVKFPTSISDSMPFYSNEYGAPSLIIEFALVGFSKDANVIIIGPENITTSNKSQEIPTYDVKSEIRSKSSPNTSGTLKKGSTSNLYHLRDNVWLNKQPELKTPNYVKFKSEDAIQISTVGKVNSPDGPTITFNKTVSWNHASFVVHNLRSKTYHREYMGVNLEYIGLIN